MAADPPCVSKRYIGLSACCSHATSLASVGACIRIECGILLVRLVMVKCTCLVGRRHQC